MTTRSFPWIAPLVGLTLVLLLPSAAETADAFDVFRCEVATIADVHAAFKARR